MSREKQIIEEMAREMCHLSAECKTCQICNERYHGDDDDLCYFKCVAKEIINHGYRKQSEGEWIVDAWDGEKFITIPYIKHEHTDPYCSLCKNHALLDGAENGVASNFCPNCGAKMKGGAE